MKTTEKFKSSVKILLTVIAIVVALSIGAISFAAWSGGGSRSLSAIGTTGEIKVIGDMTVKPIDGTGTLDVDNGILMEKLYPVDHIGDGFTYWAFELDTEVNDELNAVISVEGGIKTSGGDELSSADGELFWTFDQAVKTDPYYTSGTPLNSSPTVITVSDVSVKTRVYVYMRAYGVNAMDTTASLTFKVEFAAVDPDKIYESIKVYVPDAEGLPIRLKNSAKDVTGGEKTVTNGFAEFNDIPGDIYTIEYKGFNVWGKTDKPLYAIGAGYDVKVAIPNADILLGKSDWVSNAGEVGMDSHTDLFVDGTCIDNGWFATKISNLTDVIGAGSEIRFGFRIYYDGLATSRDWTILKQYGMWKFQIVYSWDDDSGQQICVLHDDFEEWLKSCTPFYFGVHRTETTGGLEVYMGTGLDDLVMVGSVVDPVGAGKNIVKFGVVKWRDLGAYDLTLSGTRYGKTAEEAFGAADLNLSDTNVNVTMQTVPPENAGIITVDSAIKSGKVEITLTPKDGYALTELQVNGKNKHANYVAEPMTVTVSDCYLMNEIKIDAVFGSAVTPTVSFGTEASGLKVKLVRNGVEIEKGQNVVEQDGQTILDGREIDRDGKVVFPALAVGQYEVWVYAFGVWGNSGKTVSFADGTTQEYEATLDNTTELLNGKLDEYKEVTLSGLELQDGWFATKVSGLCESTSEIRFGFRIDYDGVSDRRDFTILKRKNENTDEWEWMFQTVNSWVGFNLPDEFEAWCENGTPFYFGVHRKKIDGSLEVFMGTALDNLKLIGAVTDNSGVGKNIVEFGIIKYDGNYKCTLSDIKYGTTPKDAFGADTNIVIDEHGDVKEIK